PEARSTPTSVRHRVRESGRSEPTRESSSRPPRCTAEPCVLARASREGSISLPWSTVACSWRRSFPAGVPLIHCGRSVGLRCTGGQLPLPVGKDCIHCAKPFNLLFVIRGGGFSLLLYVAGGVLWSIMECGIRIILGHFGAAADREKGDETCSARGS